MVRKNGELVYIWHCILAAVEADYVPWVVENENEYQQVRQKNCNAHMYIHTKRRER